MKNNGEQEQTKAAYFSSESAGAGAASIKNSRERKDAAGVYSFLRAGKEYHEYGRHQGTCAGAETARCQPQPACKKAE